MGDDPVKRSIFSKALSPRYTIALAVLCLSAAAILGGVYVAYQREMQKPEIPADTPAEVREQIERLFSADREERRDAARNLGEMGEKAAPAVPALIEMLDDEPEPSLLRNVLEWANIRHPDFSRRVACWEASNALASIGEPAVEPLIAALSDTDSRVRDWAAYALGRIGDPRAVEPLIAVLSDTDKFARASAALALGRIGDPRGVEPLIAVLSDTDWYVRSIAAEALGRTGDPRAVEPLLPTLRWEKYFNPAGDGLAALGELSLEPLLAALEDDDPIVRRNAAYALGRMGHGRAVKPLIRLLDDEESRVRANATTALGRTGDGQGIEPLAAALKDTDSRVRACAATALGEIHDVRVVEPLAAALKDTDSRVRASAAAALGEIHDVRVVEPLAGALEDENPSVRVGAAVALAERRDVRAVELLIDALARDFYDVESPDGTPGLTGRLMRRDATRWKREEVAKALKNTTGQDFGPDQAKWREWWEENRDTFLDKGVDAPSDAGDALVDATNGIGEAE